MRQQFLQTVRRSAARPSSSISHNQS
jgi:hypothetical protein